jgi:hypothetical protein
MFRFYIFDLSAGDVYGTNDEARAKELSSDDAVWVVDTQTNELIASDGRSEVKEI